MNERSLHLDRMEVEEAGANKPDKLAHAIHGQLSDQLQPNQPVPVEQIAQALDIVSIVRDQLNNIEGALITTDDRCDGQVLVNSTSSIERQRFTICHELGHFLNLWHRPVDGDGFACSRQDMSSWRSPSSKALTRDERQEREANRFAIELLLPTRILNTIVDRHWSLDRLWTFSSTYQVSKEAAGRRIIECSEEPVALVFMRHNRIRYYVASTTMPRLALTKKLKPPIAALERMDDKQNVEFDIDASDITQNDIDGTVEGEILQQHNGFATMLLRLDQVEPDDDDDDDAAPEDMTSRFGRFNNRARG